jgi:hypothetical protein
MVKATSVNPPINNMNTKIFLLNELFTAFGARVALGVSTDGPKRLTKSCVICSSVYPLPTMPAIWDLKVSEDGHSQVDSASSHEPHGHMKLRVACDAEIADETVGSIRMNTTTSKATGGRADFMVLSPTPLHRTMKKDRTLL